MHALRSCSSGDGVVRYLPELQVLSKPMGELQTFLASLFGPYEQRLDCLLLGGWRTEGLTPDAEVSFHSAITAAAVKGKVEATGPGSHGSASLDFLLWVWLLLYRMM